MPNLNAKTWQVFCKKKLINFTFLSQQIKKVTILTFDRFQNCFQHLRYALTIEGKRQLFGKLLSWFVGHCLNKRP